MPNLIDSSFVKYGKTSQNPAGTDWNARALTNGTTYYSDAIPNWLFDGTASLLIVIASGGSPSITVSIEVSDDGVNWYVPYDTTPTDLSTICTALTTSRWFGMGFIVARYVRFKVVCVADATVTMKLFKREVFGA